MNPEFYHKTFSRWAKPRPACSVLLFCILILTCFCFSSTVAAGESPGIELTPDEQAWLKAHPDISLGAPTTYPPFVIKKDDGTYVGVLVDYMDAASRLLNHSVRLDVGDLWDKVQEKAEKRAIDGLAIGGRSPERVAHYSPTDTILETYFSIFARTKDEFGIKRFSDLDGMRIGYRAGASPTKHLLEKLPSATLSAYDTDEAMTQALLRKEVDVIAGWITYDFWRKQKMQGTIDNILIIDDYPMDMVTHIRKDWPEFVSIMNKVIAVMKEDELPRIMDKWFIDWPQQKLAVSGVDLTPEEKAWLKAHPNITLGTSASYPPHIVTNLDGTYTGVLPDVYEELSEILKTRINVHVGKVWSDVQKQAENRELDGLAIGGRDPNRDKFYTATDPLYSSYFSVFAPSNHDLKIDTFKDLDGLRIGYKRGARPAKTRLEKLPAATLVPFDSHESMTQALLKREIDVIVAWMAYDHWRKKTLQGTIDKIYLITETPFDMVIYIRNDWPEFVPIMNKALAVLQQKSLSSIINKWFGEWPGQTKSDRIEESIGVTEQKIDYKKLLSEDERIWLAQGHVVKARVSKYPPLMFLEPELSGLSVDYLKTISERFGIKVEFVPNKEGFARELENFMDGNSPYDLFLTLKPTPEREEKIAFTSIYLSMPWVIYSRDDTEFISGMESLDGKTVSVEKGYVMAALLEKGYPQINLLKVPTSLDALRAVATSQADSYIGNLSNATWLIREHNLDNLEIAAPSPFGTHDNAMGIRQDWPELASIINKGLASMSPEDHNAIKDRWHTITYTSKTDYSLVWKILLVMGLVALVIIYWNKLLRQQVRKRTAELSDSEERFRATFEQAAVGIAHVSPEGRFLRLNHKFCDIVGYSEEEMQNLTFQDITHPDDLDTDLDLFQELLNGKSDSYTMEKRYIRKDGSVVWINLTVKVLREEDGSPRWFVSVIEDISDRVRVQDEVKKSYVFLDHLTQTIPDAIFSVKLPERTVTWCTDTYGILGYEPRECIGETTAKFYPGPDEEEQLGMFMNKAIDEGKRLAQLELRLRRKNGEIFPAEAKLAFMEEDDRVVGVTALLRDISERKEAENKLQQSHDFFHYLLTSIPEAVFYVKLPERVIAWANDSYNIMGLGVNPEHIKDLSTKDFFASEEEYERFGVVQRQAVEEGQPIMHTETMLRHADGRVFPADVTGTFFREGGKVTGITAIARDITEVKNAEKKFIDYQERLKALSSQLTFAEEQERRRIAENLHDEVSQALAMTRLQLAAASRGAKCDDPELKDQLDEISGSLLQAIRDTRQLIFELSSPAMHELGLGPAISEWVEEKKKKFENEVDITVDDKLSGNELDDNERTILFRNIRELLNNAFKHARAKKINISLAADEEAVQITIKDDGIGFNPGQVMNGHQMDGGFGLFSVEERMKDVNGTMEIDAAPHRGCKVTLSLKRATEL